MKDLQAHLHAVFVRAVAQDPNNTGSGVYLFHRARAHSVLPNVFNGFFFVAFRCIVYIFT